jgi:hypothetical protein
MLQINASGAAVERIGFRCTSFGATLVDPGVTPLVTSAISAEKHARLQRS